MLTYALRKISATFLTLLAILFLTFLMGRSIPGGPFDSEKNQPPHIKRLQEAKYGFDKPIPTQFLTYARGLMLQGDFGVSLKSIDRPVLAILKESLPISLTLGALALLFALAVGAPLGIVAALRPDGVLDHTAGLLCVSGVTLPNFLVGALLVLVFCHWLDWLPPARLDSVEGYVLPAITLGIRPAAILARLVRSTLCDQLKMDYVRTARAKGVGETRITLHHALRNGLLPVVTVMGPIAANILTGSFIVEHFFAIPGVARHFIMAVNNRDVFLMMGVTLVFAVALIGINLLVDLVYPLLDPRMELS